MKLFLVFLLIFFEVSKATPQAPLVFPHIFLKKKILIESYGKTFVEDYLENHPSPQNEEKLLEYFELAQKHYLSQSPHLAQVYYKKVTELLWVDDWKPTHRKALSLSLLRLADLEPHQSQFWIDQALGLDPNISWAEEHVSDKLKALLKTKSTKAPVFWDISRWKKTFDLVLVNGQEISLLRTNHIELPMGNHRVVFLSPFYQPQVLTLSAQQAPFLEPIAIPFVEGSCKHPQLNAPSQPYSELLFEDCHLFLKNGKWIQKGQGAGLNSKASLDLEPEDSQALYGLTLKSTPQPFYKKTWFALVSATILGGVLLYWVNKNKKEKNSESVIVHTF